MASKSTTGNRSVREPLARLRNGLPSSWYYDATPYARDLEVFWYRRWIAAVRDEELAEAGDWRVVRIGTQSIVVLRGEHGELRAFHNTCRHRGSILCTEEAGRFARQRIVCPYHSWTYDFGGSLIATPRRMPTPDFDSKKLSLFEVAAASWGGFVFVNLDARKARPLAEALGELPERFARYGFDRLRIGKRIVVDVHANWKLLVENFSECFHCPPAHPELCRIVTSYREAGAWGLYRDADGTPPPGSDPKRRARTLRSTAPRARRRPAANSAPQSVVRSIPALLPPNCSQRASRTTSTRNRCLNPPERAHRLRLVVRATPPATLRRGTSRRRALWTSTARRKLRGAAACAPMSFCHGVYAPVKPDLSDRRKNRAGLNARGGMRATPGTSAARRHRNARTPAVDQAPGAKGRLAASRRDRVAPTPRPDSISAHTRLSRLTPAKIVLRLAWTTPRGGGRRAAARKDKRIHHLPVAGAPSLISVVAIPFVGCAYLAGSQPAQRWHLLTGCRPGR
jgi:nitrite reductase/ring-hydroxylating ferredoxin subunit